MASTNHTSNYNLSQFLGTDKPAWLADYNQDMSKIDTQMKNNADAASTADGKAVTNATNIGTLANLTTTAKTDLVSATNEINATAGTANATSIAASTAANAAKTEADALKAYLSITQNNKINVSVSGGTIGNINDVYYALNAAGTLGKVYGRLRVAVNTSGVCTVTLPVPVSTSEAFTIAAGCYYTVVNSSNTTTIMNARDFTVNTNGTITLELPTGQNGTNITIWFPPCLYFFTDFGDVYDPEA